MDAIRQQDSATVARASATLPIPDHELVRFIASGSYGEVWLARNAVGTFRAVKIVRRHTFEQTELFDREFRGLQRFEPVSRSHDGLVDILTLGLLTNRAGFYYVMELADAGKEMKKEEGRMKKPEGSPSAASISSFSILPSALEPGEEMKKEEGRMKKPEGSTSVASNSAFFILHSELERYAPRTLRFDLKTRGALPADEVITLGLKLTAAIAHLHAQGLVHRDIKPSNILFVGGVPKLADAGLVAAVDDARSLVGTAGYIAPEGPGSPQADLYALGKVLYEAAFGKDRQDFPQLPPGLRSRPDHAGLLELNAVLLKACATDRRERYQSAEQMRADLEVLQAGQSVKRRHHWRGRAKLAKKLAFGTAMLALLISGTWLLSISLNLSAPLGPKSIAVLPFDNDSSDKADGYVGDSIADEISSALTKIPGLAIIGRESSVALKNAKNARAMAQSLKLRAVLSGRCHTVSNMLYINVQLTDPRTGYQVWSGVYQRNGSEIFGIETDIAGHVAEKLNINVTSTIQLRLASRPTKNFEVYQLCLEARNLLQDGNITNRPKAIDLFQSAIRIDPYFAAAYAGLAESYIDETQESASGRENLRKALENATRAVELNPVLAEAHRAMGRVKFHYDYDWNGADKQFQRAIRMNPADALTEQMYSRCLAMIGRFDEAIQHGEQAKRLDSFSVPARRSFAWTLFDARRYWALAEFKQVLEIDKEDAIALDGAGWCYLAKGMPDDAIAMWDKFHAHSGLITGKREELSQAYHRDGLRGYWFKNIELANEGANPAHSSPFWMACDYAMLGENDHALDLLERAYEDRNFYTPWVAVQYRLYGLHKEPRFAALLDKMGLKMPVWKE